MSIDKFTFISPGIFISEIDESQNPVAEDRTLGPVIIGRTRKGPAMRPVKVSSYSEFADIFGDPHPGVPQGDIWRSGEPIGPTYASYAAKAWLLAGTAPATVVRLLGEENDKRSSSTSGWTTSKTTPSFVKADNGGAYGLFTIDSGSEARYSATGDNTHYTGTLAAVFYIDGGSSLVLSGNMRPRHDLTGAAHLGTASAGALIKSVGLNNEFKMQLYSGATKVRDYHFNFDPNNADMYIRNVFNTNATLTNSTVTDSTTLSLYENEYWLGESYERAVNEYTTETKSQWGLLLPLMSGTVAGWHDRREGTTGWVNAQTGWFFSQDYGARASFSAPESGPIKLFKFHALDYGSWANRNLKISVEDIRAPKTKTDPWGTFTIGVYHPNATTTEEAMEKFFNCTLDPSSPNYLPSVIGNKYLTWSDSTKVHTHNEQYTNKSKYIRVEMNPNLKNLDQKDVLPFGVSGPVRSVGFTYVSGSSVLSPQGHAGQKDTVHAACYVTGAAKVVPLTCAQHTDGAGGVGTAGPATGTLSAPAIYVGEPAFSGSWEFPATFQRTGSNVDYTYGKDAFFGVHSVLHKTASTYDQGYGDMTIGLPFSTHASEGKRFDTLSGLPTHTEYAWVFSLDQLSGAAGSGVYHHISGARANGTSITAASSDYNKVLDEIKQFWSPMYGGHDGLDVTEREPFRNSRWSAGTTAISDYAYHSIERAIHTVEDPEAIECNIMTIPGITNANLTDKLLGVCSTRADALAIIDIENVFTADTEDSSSEWSSRIGSVETAVAAIQARDLNNSYGCTYYPWVQVKDVTGPSLFVPPSIVALGTLATSEASSELWFAPAGFNRGGLSKNLSSNLTVINVSERLTSKKRDDLYENNINPIATFPHEGIVIFGQKTLQQTSSALDRINVRRLMIFVKKEISRIASTILFDQNVKLTWDRFTGEAEPFLASVRSRFGLTDFKVILDETTTTPDLIDRNILYAKIFLKPARAIEYIALDFTITRTGASFAD